MKNKSFPWRFARPYFFSGKYAFIGGIFILVTFTVLIVIGYLYQIPGDMHAMKINIAGKQRMLSQRIEIYSERLYSRYATEDSQVIRNLLRASVDEMERNHNALINGDAGIGLPQPASSAAREMFFASEYFVDRDIKAFLAAARLIAATQEADLNLRSPERLLIRRMTDGALLDGLDAVVALFQKESEKSTAFLMAITVVGLVLSALLMSVLVRLPLKDINWGKKTKKKLEGLLDGLLEIMEDGVISINVDGTLERVNSAAEKIFGYSADEIIGKNVNILMSDIFAVGRQSHVDGYVVNRPSRNASGKGHREILARRKDGSAVSLEISTSHLQEIPGQPVKTIAIMHDITERKHADISLRLAYRNLERQVGKRTKELRDANDKLVLNEQRFRDYADSSSDWIWEMDEDLGFSFLSKQFSSLMGHSARDWYGKRRWELAAEDTDTKKWRRHKKNMLSRLPFHDFEYLGRRIDGMTRHLRVSGKPFYDDEGKFLGYRGTSRDISGRKQVENDLKSSEERFRIIIETSPVGILTSHPSDGSIMFANVQACSIFGVPEENILGRDIRTLFDVENLDDDESCSLLKPCRNRELTFFRAGDKRGWALVSCQHIDMVGKKTLLTTVIDVTEAKETEVQLVQISKLALLGEMSAGLAHELNQPLNVIRMASESTMELLDMKPPPFEQVMKKMERISSQTQRASSIIDHMRIFGRKSGNKDSAVFSLVHATEDAVSMIRENCRLDEIDLTLDLSQSECLVMGCQVQIEQVILNLINNARDAISENRKRSGERWISLRIDDGKADDGIRLVIADSGGGIDKKQKERIFEPFYTTKDVGKGTGLGLSIAYGIVKEVGGSISVENVGPGAEFTIRFPVVAI